MGRSAMRCSPFAVTLNVMRPARKRPSVARYMACRGGTVAAQHSMLSRGRALGGLGGAGSRSEAHSVACCRSP